MVSLSKGEKKRKKKLESVVSLLSLCCPYDVPGVQKSHLRVLPNETELSIDDLDRRVCVWESTSSFYFCYSK
jgi:hypothetical protein